LRARLDKAEAIIFEGLKKDSVQFDLLFNLAYIREQKGLYEEALELYATAGTVASGDMQKRNVDEAVNRLQEMDRNLKVKDKARIVFFVKEGLDSFLGDIIKGLSGEYLVRKIIVSDFKQIDAGMEWADVCWFEWCDELVVYGSRLPLARRKKLVCRLHRYEVFIGVPPKVEWSNVDRLVIVTRHLKDLLDMYHPSIADKVKIEVIENGVDLSKYSFKRRSNGFNLAMVGYIHSRKNPVLLLQIIRKLADIDKRYKLYIAGQFQDKIIKLYWDYQVRRMGLESNVVFDGWQDDISKWLEDKNYVLSTSIHESFGYGIAEAMARGIKPIIHDFPYAFRNLGRRVSLQDRRRSGWLNQEWQV
jgi:glycosyltransferase involved in cell wall biosynthesis